MEQYAYDEIKNAIFSGEFDPGMRLYEDALAERLDMSRTPIRKAMQRLESELILESVDGKTGMQIYRPKKEDLLGLTDVRVQLESLALANAMSHGGKEQFFPLLRANEQLRAAIAENDISAILSHDGEFHSLLYEISSSKWLEATGHRINDCFALYRMLYLQNLRDGWDEAYSQHMMIYNLIMANNMNDAIDLLKYHINYYKWKPGCILSETLGM
ncbi:MAG: GntR family transcriptional regulator [Oscillospiraceae bacterium]